MANTPKGSSEQILFNVKDAGRMLGGLSPRSIRYLIANNVLKVRRLGARVFIHKDELVRFASTDHIANIAPQIQEVA
ncbi:helix-turn-helix domain-containing protein [Granulicella sp. dw_53]|uniref:helix-turn-helix domain-containing protein n=1 Tax=Granulicella sp. dw_53 TaxID=2719792 RepID=UPI001BD39738|nr:helix-turn-helix domain-containing protein [Granulicella sp. dw_53]